MTLLLACLNGKNVMDRERVRMNELVCLVMVHVNWVKGAGGGLVRLDCRCCGEQCVSDEASAAD